MKIYDETKTRLINEPNLTLGFLKPDFIEKITPATAEVIEQGHYETVKEYSNGGKDVIWVVDVPGIRAQEAVIEKEEIKIFVPYTQKEIVLMEISKLKQEIKDVDYKQLKRLRGELPDSEWLSVLEYIRTRIMRINELEKNV